MSSLSGKTGLIVGVANKRSISWAIAQAAAAAGARLALTYPSERLEENVRELAATLEKPLVLPCDVANDQQIDALTASLDAEFGGVDFVLHGAALVLPSAWVEFGGHYSSWWMEGGALVVGATGLALFWTGLTGLSPDWVE
jgi:enoyl-[acyl-carrier-protein] reductase (NADH)